jgi:GT2 family glycosyltransferase
MKIDLVVPIHNAWDYAENCFESVLKVRDKINKWIFVDDFSGSDTKSKLHAWIDSHKELDITLLTNPKQRWFTRTANTGLKASTADRVMLLNTDTVCEDDWLDELHYVMDETGSILVGSLYEPEKDKRWELTNFPGYVTGHAWLLKKECFTEVGYLDEYRDDAIHINSDRYYCYTLNAAGFKTVYSYKSKVHHYGSRSWDTRFVGNVLAMRKAQVD